MKNFLFILLIFSISCSYGQQFKEMIDSGNYTVFEIQEIAKQHFIDKGQGKGTGYKQYKRWEYLALHTMDENGYLTSKEEIANEFFKLKSQQLKITDESNWEEKGPTYWNSTSGWNPGVGRITSFSVDPDNQNHIIVGSPTGGVWKTLNGGNTWSVLTDSFINLDVYALAIHPENKNTYYWGSTSGIIFVSYDAGSSWSQLVNLSGGDVNKILIHPDTPDIMFCTIAGGGVFRSTNAGSTWSNTLTGESTGYDIEFKPGEPTTIYATGNRFYRSTNGGASFSQVSSPFTAGQTKMMAVSPANENYVYVLEENNGIFGGFYKSTNSGLSFTKLTHTANYFGYSDTGNDTRGQAPRDMDIVVSPTNIDEVHIAGIHTWRSTDGGTSFSLSSYWSEGGAISRNVGYCHADVDIMEFVGSNLYVGSDGGLFINTNSNALINNDFYTDLTSGLGIRQFYKIGVSQTDPEFIIGGSQDNGSSFYDSSGQWFDWLGADGMENFIDKNNSSVFYGTSQNGVLYKSTNGGTSYFNLSSPDGKSGNWVTPFEQDPSTPNVIYVGYDRVYKSINGGSSWSAISQDFGPNMDYLKIAPSNNQVMYGSVDGNLYKTTNGGATNWSSLSGYSGSFITDIAIHPTNPDKVAIATNSSDKIYISQDGGANWVAKRLNLPNFSVLSLVWEDTDANRLFAGLNYGIYYLAESQSQWQSFANNLPNVRVNELEINYTNQKIYAGTYGRGVFSSPLPCNATFSSSLSMICEMEGIQTGLGGGIPIGGVYSGLGVTDDGNGITFTFDPSLAGTGITTVVYNTLDSCTGNTIDLTDTIEVTDSFPLISSCNDVVLTLDGEGLASYDPSQVFDTLKITGGDTQTGTFGSTSIKVIIEQNTTVSFDWLFDSVDEPGYDDFGYSINGVFTNLSNGASYPVSGNNTVLLEVGDLFEFIVTTDDNTYGEAISTISNFSPGFYGQFADLKWIEELTESDGDASFSGNTFTVSNPCGNAIDLNISQTAFTCKDIGENIITITADNGYEVSSCDFMVTIEGPTATYTSGTWDVPPSSETKVLFADDYTTNGSSITGCSCEISPEQTVTIESGDYISIEGNIRVDGTLYIENGGSLVQVDDAAVTINNGSISVEKQTDVMNDTDFSFMGSPMSTESTSGVYGSASLVRNHDTNLFTPNASVAIFDPGAENFADEEGDNWQNHTGSLTVGEGYLVKPYPVGSGTTGAYTTTYSQGTLNSGLVTFTAVYGDSQNDSPNILSNPYASAIDAFDFINSNALVDAVYYWEHISSPSSDYPGYNSSNYDMGDISMYNLSGGLSASNEQVGAPVSKPSNRFIASGQGFGIKANAAGMVSFTNGMRVTDNNDGYRNNEIVDRLYLSVSNSVYDLHAGTLIAFTAGATNGYDRNYDAKRLATSISLYSINEDRELGIQGREPFNVDDIIPLGFSTQVEESQEYVIGLDAIEGDGLTQSAVYLEDRLLQRVTNLKDTDYRFIADKGHQTDRFEILFVNEVLGINDTNLTSISVYPNPAASELTIASPFEEIIQVAMYDIGGRLINRKKIAQKNQVTIDISSLANAMYFVRISTPNHTVIKRVVKE